MVSVKKKMTSIIRQQPDDSSYEEILSELAFARMVERGLDDVQKKRVLSNQDMRRRIKAWK